jgi:hypothetical protein
LAWCRVNLWVRLGVGIPHLRPTCAVTTLHPALLTSQMSRVPERMDADMRNEVVTKWFGWRVAASHSARHVMRWDGWEWQG